MAAYGAQLEQGKTPGRGAGTTCTSCSRTSRCRTTAPARRCRRSPAARATSCSPTRTRRSSPRQKGEDVDYIVPDQTILIENPVAVTTNSAHPPAGQGVRWTSCTRRTAQKIFADNGYRPVVPGVARAVRLPDPAAGCSRSTTSAAGRKVNDQFFDPSNGRRCAKIEQSIGVVEPTASDGTRPQRAGRSAAPPSRPRRRPGPSSASASAIALPQPDRADPAGGRRLARRRRRLGRLLARRHRRRDAVAALKLTVAVSLIVVAGQRGDRHAASPGCWCATTSPASASSTR